MIALGAWLSLLLATAPAAPTNVVARVIRTTVAPDTDVDVVTWTLPPGTLTYTHTRLIPGNVAVPALGADVNSVCPVASPPGGWHQYAGARTVDTFKVLIPTTAPTAVACQPIVRVGDATGPSAWAVGATLCYSRNGTPCPAASPLPPGPARISVAPVAIELNTGVPGGVAIGLATATVWDSLGGAWRGSVVWTSSAPLVATVDTGGAITARAVGVDTVRAWIGTLASNPLVVTVKPFPPSAPPLCGADVPPRVGCGMRAPLWALLLGPPVAGTYGPWYVLDSLGQRQRVVRVTVKDTVLP